MCLVFCGVFGVCWVTDLFSVYFHVFVGASLVAVALHVVVCVDLFLGRGFVACAVAAGYVVYSSSCACAVVRVGVLVWVEVCVFSWELFVVAREVLEDLPTEPFFLFLVD